MKATARAKQVAKQFAEWASLYSGKLFVQLIVYADESGTHDPSGKLEGSKAPVVAGFMDTVEHWETLCVDWQAVLDKYGAPYFHFRETHRSNRLEEGNPYHGWSDEKIDDFIYDLATIISRTAVPVGGSAYAAFIKNADPFKITLWQFFESFTEAAGAHWPSFNQPISFFFDQQENNSEWVARLRGRSLWPSADPCACCGPSRQ